MTELSWLVTREDAGLPVGRILTGRLGLTKHQVRTAKFASGGIRCNGRQVRVSAPVQPGDRISICLADERPGRLMGQTWEMTGQAGERMQSGMTGDGLWVLYEDESLLVVNKPSGLALHPGHGHYHDTISWQVHCHLQAQAREQTPQEDTPKEQTSQRVRSVGRLDRDTSGVVLFAKSRIACERLQRPGACEKEYEALVCGGMPGMAEQWQLIDLPIARDDAALNRMCIHPEGKEARTWYRVTEKLPDVTRLCLRLETGRTHQIRVHLWALGHPVVSDEIYGTPLEGRDLALHCRWLRISHPFSGRRLEIEAPLPDALLWEAK